MAQLVRLTGLFGISENRARVALSRMVAAGEATSDGSGRYPAGGAPGRRSRPVGQPGRPTVPFDGRWWMAVVTTTGSTAEVRAPGVGPWPTRAWPIREGVWMRPANVAVQFGGALHGDVELMTAQPEDRGAGRPPVGPDRVVGAGERPAAGTSGGSPPTGPRRGAGLRALRRCAPAPAGRPPVADELLPRGPPVRLLRGADAVWDFRYRASLREWELGRAERVGARAREGGPSPPWAMISSSVEHVERAGGSVVVDEGDAVAARRDGQAEGSPPEAKGSIVSEST